MSPEKQIFVKEKVILDKLSFELQGWAVTGGVRECAT